MKLFERRWLVVAGVAGVVAAIVTVALLAGGGASPGRPPAGAEPAATTTIPLGVDPLIAEEQRAALQAYEEALDPLAYDAGRVVVQGLRAGLGDLYRGDLPPEQIAEMAAAWSRELSGIREQMAALEVPAFLAEAARLLDEAMAGYVETAQLLKAAAEGPQDDLDAATDPVVDAGEAADDTWDEGVALLQGHRDRLGLEGPSPLGG